MSFTMVGGWFQNTIAYFFIRLIDTVAYNFLAVTYNIFAAVANIDLFGGSAAGQKIYDSITGRFYTALSVIMIFVFAYQLLMLIIDPEGKEAKSSSSLVKDTLVSIIWVILLPTVFKYMMLFQRHVLTDGTVAQLILGSNGGHSTNPGKTISLMVFMAFYHPYETTYSTFFDRDGNLIAYETAHENCRLACSDSTGEKCTETCKLYWEGLDEWMEDEHSSAIGDLTTIEKLRHWTNDTMEYLWVLSTAAAVITAWFFITYSIAIGTRAVKLGVLQLISPIPVILRIFPQTRKTYESWFGEMKKTYLELFIRLGVIFFIVELIRNVPEFIRVIFDNTSLDGVDGFTRCLAMVCLILGMLQFAKDAPDLFKTLFSNGGNLLSGLSFRPGVRRQIENNAYAMKALGAGIGLTTGAIGAVGKRFYDHYKAGGGNITGTSSRVGSFLLGLTAAPRGVISGARRGLKNSPTRLTKDALKDVAKEGTRAAQESLENRKFKGITDRVENAYRARKNGGSFVDTFRSEQADAMSDWAEDVVSKSSETWSSFKDTITGRSRDYGRATTTAESISKNADEILSRGKGANKKLETKKTAIQNEIYAGKKYFNQLDGKYYGEIEKQFDLKIFQAKYGPLVAKSNSNGTTTYYTNSGTSFNVGANGKIISTSRGENTQRLAAAEKAMVNSGAFTSKGQKYCDVSKEMAEILKNQHQNITSTWTGNNGEKIIEFKSQDGKEYVEYKFADGITTVESKSGDVKYSVDANNVVVNKEVKIVNSNGTVTTDVYKNADTYIELLKHKAENEAIYNVETIYQEIDDQMDENIAESLRDTSDARCINSSNMLAQLKDNINSFGKEYYDDVKKEFTDKFPGGETIEEFLMRMSDRNLDPTTITKEDAKKYKAVRKIMNKEVARSNASADAEKQRKEQLNQKKPSDKNNSQ